MSGSTIAQADVRRLPFADGVAQCCVTSPPYFGHRDYQVAEQIGLEPTPAEYVAQIVAAMREVWRVLRDDGCVFLNLGDSFSNGVGSNVTDFLERSMKGFPLFVGNATAIRVTAHGGDVSLHDNGFPYGVFFSLLGIERITIKQRDNNFSQVLYTLAVPCYCRIDCPVCFARIDAAHLEIVLDSGYRASIVISEHNTNREPVFGILRSPGIGARENGDSPLTIKETAKPITEIITNGKPYGNPVAFDTVLESFPDVYLVNESVPLRDCLSTFTSSLSNFRVAKASNKQITLALGNSGIDLTAIDISHLYAPNEFGSLVRYEELYAQAIRLSNALQPKQEIGIPDMVKRALMEDGWLCRSTIIWAKKNCMPESVTDRPTRSHEYIFLLAKQARYYWDAEAVKEKAIHAGKVVTLGDKSLSRGTQTAQGLTHWGNGAADSVTVADGRNIRSVWTTDDELSEFIKYAASQGVDINALMAAYLDGQRDLKGVWSIATQPYSAAHFATFPPEIPRRCILAGTSARGACPLCGAPWERVVERNSSYNGKRDTGDTYTAKAYGDTPQSEPRGSKKNLGGDVTGAITTGWHPSCECFGHFEYVDLPSDWLDNIPGDDDTDDRDDDERGITTPKPELERRKKRVYVPHGEQPAPVPCIVIDPFAGSGTTGKVAIELGRRFIGCDLNADYIALSHDRMTTTMGMGI